MAEMLESGGIPAALGWRIRAAQLEPNNMTNRLSWAETAIKMRDLKSATDALAGLDEKSKATATYHKLSGALAWGLGKNAEAEKHYREALRLEPGNMSIVMNLDTIGLASTNSAVATARVSRLSKWRPTRSSGSLPFAIWLRMRACASRIPRR